MSHTSLVTVTKLSPKGEGIALDAGREIYIENVLVGEQVEVEVGQPFVPNSKRCPGKVISIVKPSKDRQSTALCQYFGSCGGCALQHMTYTSQLKLKRLDIKDALEEVVKSLKRPELLNSDMLDEFIRETHSCSVQPCRFKSIRYFANNTQSNQLEQGFFASRSHDLIAIDSCPLEPECFATIANELNTTLSSLNLKAVDGADNGTLKAMQLRQCDDGVAVLLITTQSLTSQEQETLKATAQSLELASLYVGINTQDGNSLYCDEVTLIHGASRLSKNIAGKDFYVGPQTFVQVNYDVCEQLYGAAVAHCASVNASASACANSNATESGAGAACKQARGKAIDLCCGVGTMTLALADHFDEVTGVEIVQSSIDAAKENAQRNGISNVSFIASDMSKALPKLLSKDMLSDVKAVIADPARAGIGANNAALLAKIKGPCKVSMIFCSLKALKRDLAPLLLGGFKIDYVQGFDMFPHSVHIETLICLTKD